MKLECYSCNHVFDEKEKTQEEIPPNFFFHSCQKNKVDACPKCGAVAFLGFERIK